MIEILFLFVVGGLVLCAALAAFMGPMAFVLLPLAGLYCLLLPPLWAVIAAFGTIVAWDCLDWFGKPSRY